VYNSLLLFLLYYIYLTWKEARGAWCLTMCLRARLPRKCSNANPPRSIPLSTTPL
jgi:hypothetical protein